MLRGFALRRARRTCASAPAAAGAVSPMARCFFNPALSGGDAVVTRQVNLRTSSVLNEETYRSLAAPVPLEPVWAHLNWATPLAELPAEFSNDDLRCRVLGAGTPLACIAGGPDPYLPVLAEAGAIVARKPKQPLLTAEEIYSAASIISQRSIDRETGWYSNAPPPRLAAPPADYAAALPARTRYFRHGAVEVFALPLRAELADLPLVDQLYRFRRPHTVISDQAAPVDADTRLDFFTEPASALDRAEGVYVSPSLLTSAEFLRLSASQLTPGYVAAATAEALTRPEGEPLVRRPSTPPSTVEGAPELVLAGRPRVISRLNFAYRRAFDAPPSEPLSPLHRSMALHTETTPDTSVLGECVLRFEPALLLARALRAAVEAHAAGEKPHTVFVFYDHALTTHLEMCYDVLPALSPADWKYLEHGYPAALFELTGGSEDIASPYAPVSAEGRELWDDAVARARERHAAYAEALTDLRAHRRAAAPAAAPHTGAGAGAGTNADEDADRPPTREEESALEGSYGLLPPGRALWRECLTPFSVFHASPAHARPWVHTTRLFTALYGPHAARAPTCGRCEQTEDASGFYRSCCREPIGTGLFDGAPLHGYWFWPESSPGWQACSRAVATPTLQARAHRMSEAPPPSPCDAEYARTGIPVDDWPESLHIRPHRLPPVAPAQQQQQQQQQAAAEAAAAADAEADDGAWPWQYSHDQTNNLIRALVSQATGAFPLPPGPLQDPPTPGTDSGYDNPFAAQVGANWAAAAASTERFLTRVSGAPQVLLRGWSHLLPGPHDPAARAAVTLLSQCADSAAERRAHALNGGARADAFYTKAGAGADTGARGTGAAAAAGAAAAVLNALVVNITSPHTKGYREDAAAAVARALSPTSVSSAASASASAAVAASDARLFSELPGWDSLVTSYPGLEATLDATKASAESATPDGAGNNDAPLVLSLGVRAADDYRSPALRPDELMHLTRCLTQAAASSSDIARATAKLTKDQQIFSFAAAATGGHTEQAMEHRRCQAVYRGLTGKDLMTDEFEALLVSGLRRNAAAVARESVHALRRSGSGALRRVKGMFDKLFGKDDKGEL